ncbi:MAG: hypothetical protein LN575_00510 [Rickettsia endosymbiont of Gnoriste bilineata]|nr:hypothetical protein [Rickettsia endosymbiont of Gnoriste bilineata]
MLKSQPFVTKHNIKLTIDSIKQKVVLHFEYDGYPIMTAQELLKTSNNFFKTHANPFLLNLSQVFNLLQTNGYNYQVSHNQSNVIEIYSNDLKNWNNQQEENVILLNSLIKRKKMNKKFLLLIILIMVNDSFAQEQISNLIIPVSYFVSHENQRNALKDSLSKHKQVSIVGTSGIGKTQFVRMRAYDNKADYDIIWFFDCNVDLNEQFFKLAKQLNSIRNANISENVTLAKKEVISYLTHKDKWLLIFDNLKINENNKVQ